MIKLRKIEHLFIINFHSDILFYTYELYTDIGVSLIKSGFIKIKMGRYNDIENREGFVLTPKGKKYYNFYNKL